MKWKMTFLFLGWFFFILASIFFYQILFKGAWPPYEEGVYPGMGIFYTVSRWTIRDDQINGGQRNLEIQNLLGYPLVSIMKFDHVTDGEIKLESPSFDSKHIIHWGAEQTQKRLKSLRFSFLSVAYAMPTPQPMIVEDATMVNLGTQTFYHFAHEGDKRTRVDVFYVEDEKTKNVYVLSFFDQSKRFIKRFLTAFDIR